MGISGRLGLVIRAMFSILILVGLGLSLGVGMLESVESETNSTYLSKSEVAAEKLLQVHPNSDFNFNMSKRRVPNGPDPIHNRRAGNSGRPPGQA
ncbi:hypothetical protein AgCh_019570 [Apium graveolens]